jgi:hypothetical protein
MIRRKRGPIRVRVRIFMLFFRFRLIVETALLYFLILLCVIVF